MKCLENRKENEKTAARGANAPQPGRPELHHTPEEENNPAETNPAGTSSGAAPGGALVAWHIPKCTATRPDSALVGLVGGGTQLTVWEGSSEGCSPRTVLRPPEGTVLTLQLENAYFHNICKK